MNENERKVVVRRMLLLIAVACIIMGQMCIRDSPACPVRALGTGAGAGT